METAAGQRVPNSIETTSDATPSGIRQRSDAWVPVAILLALILAVGLAGMWIYGMLTERMKFERQRDLAAVTSLKAQQIANWMAERRTNAETLMTAPVFTRMLQGWIAAGRTDNEFKDMLLGRLDDHRRAYRYDAVLLLDDQAGTLLRAGPLEAPNAREQALALEAMRTGQVVFSDLHWEVAAGRAEIGIDLFSPLSVETPDGRRALGAIFFRIDPNEYLYPFVQSWPTPSRTAESMLLRIEGGEIVYLNELRHRTGTALRLRIPADKPDLAGGMIVRGDRDVVEGIDYRDVPVLAAGRKVSGTDWFLVSKIDQDEIYAPIRNLAALLGTVVALFIAGAGVAVRLWWRGQHAAFLAARYRVEMERQSLAARLDFVTRHANDIVILMDEQTRIVDVNQRALQSYGYARDELLGMSSRELRAPEAAASYDRDVALVDERGGHVYETVHRRKDGSAFPVEISGRFIDIGGRRFRQSIVRDVTERKLAQEHILRLNRVYAALNQTNQAIVRIRDADSLFHTICRVAVEQGGLRMAWVGMLDPGSGKVNPAASSGSGLDFLEHAGPFSMRDDPRAPVEIALREGRPYLCNDLGSDPALEPIREDIRRAGFGSAASFPLRLGTKIVGGLTLYAGEKGYFDEMITNLAAEMAADVSFALENFEKEALRKAADGRLRELSHAVESSANGILITEYRESANPIIYVNPAFERITGYPGAEVVGRNPAFLHGDEKDQVGLAEIRAALREQRQGKAVLRNYRKDRSVFWNELAISPVRDAAGRVTRYVGVINDITERKQYEEQLERQANRDALTGLASRNLAKDRTTQAIAYASRLGRTVALLFLDLDRFKLVNDSLGHTIGDALLGAVAVRIADCVRGGDTVARLGGDEFVIVLADTAKEDDASRVARKLLDAVAEPIWIGEREFLISASIGVSLYPKDGADYDTLLKNADVAMYRAKDAGRNSYRFYTADMNARALHRLILETRLRRALDRGELVLHYQPLVSLQSGRVTDAEALLRWRSSEHDLASPGEFIAIAEETGLIVPMGAWALHEACREAKSWVDAGQPSLNVAVNLSAHQFRDRGLARSVRGALEASGLPPPLLKLEITESAIMHDADESSAILAELRSIGVRIAMDDFGTGYSSLAYLKRFPIDQLKIDRSFVRDVTRDPASAALAQGIVALARSLQLQTVAEGVETQEQRDFMKAAGCDKFQGYFFSPPLPAEQFLVLLGRPEDGREG